MLNSKGVGSGKRCRSGSFLVAIRALSGIRTIAARQSIQNSVAGRDENARPNLLSLENIQEATDHDSSTMKSNFKIVKPLFRN